MRTITHVVLTGAVVLVMAGSTARAHHAFSSEFDAAKPVTLTGVVKKMEWINPHSWLTIEVKAANGATDTWEIEAGAPNAMFRRGFNRNSLPVGTTVVVSGFQAKDGRKRANGRDITFADGKRLFMGSSGTGAPGDAKQPQP
jgi:hypothetical protein